MAREMVDGGRKLARSQPVWGQLLTYAHSNLSETDAAQRLRSTWGQHPDAARHTLARLKRLGILHEGYIVFRAQRISALSAGRPVLSVSPEQLAYFERERQLGERTLTQAVVWLSEQVPELDELLHAVEVSPAQAGSLAADQKLVLSDRVGALVGPHSPHPDPLVRSTLAQTTLSRYLSSRAGSSQFQADDQQYGLALEEIAQRRTRPRDPGFTITIGTPAARDQ